MPKNAVRTRDTWVRFAWVARRAAAGNSTTEEDRWSRRPGFYLARHLVAVRLEQFRLGEPQLSATYDDVREVLAALA